MNDRLPPPPEEQRNTLLYNDLFGQLRRVIFNSPQMEGRLSPRTGRPFAWEATSQLERWGQPIRRFGELEAIRDPALAEVDARFGAPPFGELVLPAADLPDGTPTQRLYFFNRDWTISYYLEYLVPLADGEDADFVTLDYLPNLPFADREALLAELQSLDDVDDGL